MAYINQETKANIVAAVKPILKKYGVKASFGIDNHSTFVVNIKSGVLDFIGNANEVIQNRAYGDKVEGNVIYDYIQVNQYWINDNYTGAVRNFLVELYAAIKAAGNWFDKSDIQTDYFHTAFYIDVNVGKWNKAYELTA